MATLSESLRLNPDELAFYFSGEGGIEATELGRFLQRAATVARQEGAELRVLATVPGSLAVIVRAARSSKVGRAASKEFYKAPIASTGIAVGIVGAVASAIVFAMTPEKAGVTPLGKAGADVVERQKVERIEIVTMNETHIVMDRPRARRVRELERASKNLPGLPAPEAVLAIADDGLRGTLTGAIYDIDGELHFRPDGYRFLVPVDMSTSEAREELWPIGHFRVKGELQTRRGQPSAIIIHSAQRI